jgi:hypothetical protein
MESNVANQNEEMTQIIRYAPWTNRPHSPPQACWQGPPPRNAKKIMTRAALDTHWRESYIKWASNFALLTDEFIAQVVKHASRGTDQSAAGKWEGIKWVDSYYCQVGDDVDYLWVQKHDGGWTVELCYPDNADPDARVLTIEKMPVLCPDGPSAARLAQACYPKPAANLVWHSYW